MATRVLIVCADGETVSPGIYKHYDGYQAPAIIAAANSIAAGQRSRPEQAATLIATVAVNTEIEHTRRYEEAHGPSPYKMAPFILTQETDEDLRTAILGWLGAETGHAALAALRDVDQIASDYELDAGLVVVDVRTAEWCWRAFAGDLERHELCGTNGGVAA